MNYFLLPLIYGYLDRRIRREYGKFIGATSVNEIMSRSNFYCSKNKVWVEAVLTLVVPFGFYALVFKSMSEFYGTFFVSLIIIILCVPFVGMIAFSFRARIVIENGELIIFGLWHVKRKMLSDIVCVNIENFKIVIILNGGEIVEIPLVYRDMKYLYARIVFALSTSY